jgi:hypothetical protein
MGLTLAALTCALFLSADQPTPPKPSPFAPSLPELTEEEEQKYDDIINRFIDFDSGKLQGDGLKEARADLEKLGADATFALIRGLNRAAKIEHSCPALTIARKLERLFNKTTDNELLQFARENIGAGITESRHMASLRHLRLVCMLRQRDLQVAKADTRTSSRLKGRETSPTNSGDRKLRGMSLTELVEASGKERGPKLKMVLTELGRRPGEESIGALGAAASLYDGETQKLARDLLKRQLTGLSSKTLKAKLKDDRAEVRAATARVAADKGLHWEDQFIELLTDDEAVVREAAHQALVKFSKGKDYGPRQDAPAAERKEAVQKWRAWLAQQNGQ